MSIAAPAPQKVAPLLGLAAGYLARSGGPIPSTHVYPMDQIRLIKHKRTAKLTSIGEYQTLPPRAERRPVASAHASCAIAVFIPLPLPTAIYTNFIGCPFVPRTRSTNPLGHGHGYKCHSPSCLGVAFLLMKDPG